MFWGKNMKSRFSINQLLKGLVVAGVLVVGLLVFISIGANNRIIASQKSLAEVILPLEQAAKITETTVWHYIASRNRLQSATSLEDLEAIKARNDADADYEDQEETLKDLAVKAPEISAHILELHNSFMTFQGTYNDVYTAVAAGINLNQTIDLKITELDALNEQFKKNTEAIAGKVNFASMRKRFAVKKILKQKDAPAALRAAIGDYLQGDLDTAQKACTALMRAASSLAADGRSLILVKNKDSLNSVKANQINQNLQVIERSLKTLTGSSVLSVEQKKMVSTLTAIFSDLQRVLIGEGDSLYVLRGKWFVEQEKIEGILVTSKESTVQILTSLTNLSETGEVIYANVEDEIGRVNQMAFRLIVGAGALAAAAMILAGMYIISKIVEPLARAVDITNHLAHGDLTVEVDTDSKDELLISMGVMVNNIADSIKSSTTIATRLASSSSRQAASIEETSSAVAEISSMTSQNLEETTVADQQVKEINHLMTSVDESMGDMKNAMENIAEASSNTQKIIKSIDEIAFQTNLLALNAAVEAARAGEAGAGFAVVAEEVRNLAMRSAAAASDTNSLIETTVAKIDNGQAVVQQTSQQFAQIVVLSENIEKVIDSIAHASQEQAQGLSQINTTMSELDVLTQENASNANELTSAMAHFRVEGVADDEADTLLLS